MNIADIDLLERLAVLEARNSFWAYRQYINPKMKKGWWQKQVAGLLQDFYTELNEGKRPIYVIEAPPQHGKSIQIIEFLSWLAGKNPDLKSIYTSFSERLGIRANLRLQRIYDSEKYKKIFPETRINESSSVTISGQHLRNREIIEYVGREGFFRNTTVRGSITGEGLDLGIIDDPIKGREEAGSITVREKTWEWFTDDFFTRFSDQAGMLAILTRWHVDDPIGRLKESMPGKVKCFSYPALASDDSKLMNIDPREKGSNEALFPEHKSKDFIIERKNVMASVNFQALYQQNPQIIGGQLIRGSWFQRYTLAPKILHRAVFADTAQKTKEHNDYSVFECWGKGEDGKAYLLDLIRGKWEAPELRQRAVDFWRKHAADVAKGPLRVMKVEDKSSGTGLIQDLKINAQIPVKGIPRTTDKLTRCMDVVSYIESGYVCLPEEAPWVSDFIAECEAFTADDTHAHDDQLDPMFDAIGDFLAARPRGIVNVLSQKK